MTRPLVSIDVRMLGSGIGSYIRTIMPRLIDNCPDVDFVLLGPQIYLVEIFGERPNVRYIDTSIPRYSLAEQRDLPKIIPPETALHWTPHFNIPVFSKKPQLTTIHDVLFLAHPEWFPGSFRLMITKALFKAALRRSERIMAVSEFTKSEIARLLKPDMSKVHVVHNGIDLTDNAFTAEPLPTDKPFIFSMGNVKPHKNFATLILAFAQIQDHIPHDLLIAGQIDDLITEDIALQQAVAKGGDRVKMLGYVSTNTLHNLYSHAELCVFPSLYEGFGYGPLESMLFNTPALSSDIPAAREVCGSAVQYFDPHSVEHLAKSIADLLNDKARSSNLREVGLEQIRKFPIEQTVAQTESHVRELLNCPKR
ncbi:MAG: glycosyltransferase family 4 protein [Fimbriimonadaceae bacterium]|nr:glycosyltransferase family 4 protein [Fimbriimonadaceae bacterium]